MTLMMMMMMMMMMMEKVQLFQYQGGQEVVQSFDCLNLLKGNL